MKTVEKDDKKVLLANIDKLHTTRLGEARIQKNLGISSGVVEYCKDKILDKDCNIYARGKNWYCEVDDIKITVNARRYTMITAHLIEPTKGVKDDADIR